MAVGTLMRPCTADHSRRRRGRRDLRTRRARGDPAAIHQHGPPVLEDQRRHDVITGAPLQDLVVDQDLPRSIEATDDDNVPVAPRGPVDDAPWAMRPAARRSPHRPASRSASFCSILRCCHCPAATNSAMPDNGRHGRQQPWPEATFVRRRGGSIHDRQREERGTIVTLTHSRQAAGMKIIVAAVLIAIVVALFSALVFLYRDAGRGKRVVWRSRSESRCRWACSHSCGSRTGWDGSGRRASGSEPARDVSANESSRTVPPCGSLPSSPLNQASQ